MLTDGELVEPVVEEAEPVLPGVQAAPCGAGGLLLQGHHVPVIHGTVDAVIDGGRQAWAGGVFSPSADAGDQAREEHLGTYSPVRILQGSSAQICVDCNLLQAARGLQTLLQRWDRGKFDETSRSYTPDCL